MRSVGLVCVVLAGVLVALAPGIRAAGSTWTQSDWSGSSGQQAWSGASSFDTSLNLVTSTANQLTLGQTMATGTGNDGAITVTGTTNLNTQNLIAGRSCADGGDAVDYLLSGSVAANASSLTLTTAPAAGCLASGDEVLVIYMQGGASSDPSTVGTYETDVVAGVSGTTLSLQTPLVNGYSASNSSSQAQAVMVQRVPNYTNVTVASSATLTASGWNGSTGGVLFFRATGTVTVHGKIDVDGLGYAGGVATAPASSSEWAKTGEGVLPPIVASGGGDKDGGGGGITNQSGVNDSSGGGGGGSAGNGGAGAGKGTGGGSPSGSGAAYGTVSLTQLLPGGGGGAGGGADATCSQYAVSSSSSVRGGNGGAGGGILVVSAGTIASDGTISADGSDGSQRPLNPNNPNASTTPLSSAYGNSPDPPCGGGGGGGAGGSIFLSATSSADFASGTLSAAGANGGDGTHWGGVGGGGGGGAVLLSVVSGATLGTSALSAQGGQYGTPVSGGASGTGGSSGAVTIWRPTSATISGSTSPTFTAQQASTYQRNGSLTSSIFDSGSSAGADWGTLAYTVSLPSGTSATLRVRTGNQSNLSDASSFASCPAISSGASLAGTSCVTQGDRYAQYQLALTGAGTSTPSVTQVSVSYTVIPSTTTSSGSSHQTTTTSAPATTTTTPATSVPRPTTPPKPVPPKPVPPKPGKGVPSRGKPKVAPAITVNLPPLDGGARGATARSATAAAKLPHGVHVKAYSWTVDGAAAGNGAKLSYRFSRHNHWYRVTLRARLSTGVVAKTGVLVDSVRVVRAMRARVHYVYAATTATNGVAEQTAEVAAAVTKARRGLTRASIAIECTGYSSASAPSGVHYPASELTLSQRRASAACHLLRRRLGTAGLTYVERGRGGADAVGDNTTAAGRAANRRVAITVTITGWAVKPDGRPR